MTTPAGRPQPTPGHRLRPELHHVASDGDDGVEDGLHAAYTRPRARPRAAASGLTQAPPTPPGVGFL